MAATESGKDKIIAAAEKIFIKLGFDGASISKIAQEAGVTRSLIFHHFENKQALWEGVKVTALEKAAIREEALIKQASESVEGFIEVFIQGRMAFYIENPNFTRMMAWQSLDLDSIKRWPEHIERWKKPIQILQEKGMITEQYSASCLLAWLIASTTGFMTLHLADALNNDAIDVYISMLRSEFKRILVSS